MTKKNATLPRQWKKVSEAVTSLGHVLVFYPDVLVSEEALVSEDRRPLQKPMPMRFRSQDLRFSNQNVRFRKDGIVDRFHIHIYNIYLHYLHLFYCL